MKYAIRTLHTMALSIYGFHVKRPGEGRPTGANEITFMRVPGHFENKNFLGKLSALRHGVQYVRSCVFVEAFAR